MSARIQNGFRNGSDDFDSYTTSTTNGIRRFIQKFICSAGKGIDRAAFARAWK